MKFKSLFFMFIFIINFISIVQANDITLAVLEQPQCQDNSDLMIRILFAKKNYEWISLDTQPVGESYDFSKIIWTIAFDGRNIGHVQPFEPNSSKDSNSSFTLLQIKQGDNAPRILNKNIEFWGWCNAPEFRPLVLVSKLNFKDPAGWKPFSPSKTINRELFSEFKKIVGAVDRCLSEQESKRIPYDYQAQDLKIFKSYQNILGQKLISIGLNPDFYKCDGIIEPQWKPYWFLIDKQIRCIGTEFTLVDAGDYDNDRRSEVIFWHSGYNEDGYTLFYDNFNKRIDSYWKYQ